MSPDGNTPVRRTSDNPRRELVREQLVTAAAKLFHDRGYAQTSLNDIAAEIGLGRSSIYHYFRNKEEILAELVREQSLRPYEALTGIALESGLSGAERLRRAVMEGIVRRLTGGPRFRVIGRIEADLTPELSALLARSKRQVLDIYRGFIEQGVREGSFRPVEPRIAAFAVIGMANWTSWWYSPAGKSTPQEIAGFIADFALRGLLVSATDQAQPADMGTAIARLRDDLAALERFAI